MYRFETPLAAVKGIGPTLSTTLAAKNLQTVKDLLLFLPLRYEDRSSRATVAQLTKGELVTILAEVVSSSTYYKGPRSIHTAVIKDDTSKVKAMWFNNRFIKDKLKVGQQYLFSGKLNDRGILVQPVVEDVKEVTLHTDRLVPLYSMIPTIKQGSLRRILKHILDNLQPLNDTIPEKVSSEPKPMKLDESLSQLHFPDKAELVIRARERLALEELLGLMLRSQQIKQSWEEQHDAPVIEIKMLHQGKPLPPLPFTLTKGQQKALAEILEDLQKDVAMNRLLVGDVGSGKTVVAGVAALQCLANQRSAALVAPTRILAEQHAATLAKLFPDIRLELVTSTTKKLTTQTDSPALYIGTHAVINRLSAIQPALLIYDEQHRFGVKQRSKSLELDYAPHVLTMSATPIPRSLMLTIFSHLSLSVIDELPAGRLPIKTWLVPETKRENGYQWVWEELQSMTAAMKGEKNKVAQAFVICPFIDPSNSEALENIAAVKDKFEELQRFYTTTSSSHTPRLAMLHGRMTKKDQNEAIEKVRAGEVDILVTTPIVEVGIDVPTANIMVIEAAERFGLASLHQLRGRVGRAGQQAYCLLFTNTRTETKRLEEFSNITKGSELAELDLKYRGAGDIFGTQQHGFDNLRFASWANVELIALTRAVFAQISGDASWKPLFYQPVESENLEYPLAN